MKARLSFFSLATILFCSGSLRAQAITIQMDPAQTQIAWTLPDVLHTVQGTFQLASGSITFDPKTGAATGLFTVDENSAASSEHMRDRHMKKSILETALYPTVTFKPTHVSGPYNPQGASTLTVDGIFHLHGADHAQQWMFQVNAHDNHIAATTKFEIPYVAWGLRNPSTLFLRVGTSIHMVIDTVGTVQTTP